MDASDDSGLSEGGHGVDPWGIHPEDAAYLAAQLLLWVARVDGEIADVETDMIISLLSARFGIGSARALGLVRQAQQATAPGQALPRELGDRARRLDSELKRQILVMLLQVAGADGRREADELHGINHASELMGMTAADVHAAYQAFFGTIRGQFT